MDTPTRGRNPLNVIMTLPGVQTVASNDYRGWNGGGIPGVNGGQQGQIILNMDGAASQDSGNLNPGYISPSMDAIGEVRLLTSNYTAEYGGRTAGQLTLTTKNGTPTFHGSLLLLLAPRIVQRQHVLQQQDQRVRPRYRYQNPGGTIGGPLIIPGTNFNKRRQKLFFFFSYDKLLNNTDRHRDLHHAVRAGAGGRFLEDRDHAPACRCRSSIPRPRRRFPNNVVPDQSHQPAGAGDVEPVPAAGSARVWRSIPTGNRGYNFRVPLPAVAAARRQDPARRLQPLAQDG